MALGSTQPLTVPGVFPGGKAGRGVRLTTLPPSCFVMKSGNLNFLEPSGPLQACNGTALPLYQFITVFIADTKLTLSWVRCMQAKSSHVIFVLFNIIIQPNLTKSQTWLMNIVTRLLAYITKNLGLKRAEIALFTTVSRLDMRSSTSQPPNTATLSSELQRRAGVHPEFLSGGGVRPCGYMKFMFDFKNYVIKITS
jgi:hypothetical protein